MESALYTLATSAIAGLTWIAYAHPLPYKRITPVFTIFVVVFVVGAFAHRYGVTSSQQVFVVSEAYMKLVPAHRRAVLDAMDGQVLQSKYFVAVVGTYCYIIALSFLPDIGITKIEK